MQQVVLDYMVAVADFALPDPRSEDDIKEWTGMDFASSTRAAETRTR